MEPPIPTRLLVMSDTHAEDLPDSLKTSAPADVAIHCGDLTEASKMCEFRKALRLLKATRAPLKIAIAGNHDWTLDLPTFRQKVQAAGLASDPALVAREYGGYGEVRALFDEARATHNIHLLDEGTHCFTLANGARLAVYASPFTPSADADWGFQYRPQDGHAYDIGRGDSAPDVVLTHGPPQGVLDRADGQRLGCPQLFAAVARSRPLVHCFGHVHAGWGARHVAWQDHLGPDSTPTHFDAIDNGKSTVIDPLRAYRRDKAASRLYEDGLQQYSTLEHARGTKTLCINAAMLGDGDIPFHVPWVVDVPLQKAG